MSYALTQRLRPVSFVAGGKSNAKGHATMLHVLFVNGEVRFVFGRVDRVYLGVLVSGEKLEAHTSDRPMRITKVSPQRKETIRCQARVEAELVNEFIAYKQWTRTFLHDWLSLLSCKSPLYCLPAQWEEWLQSEMGCQLGPLRDNINDSQSSKENLLKTNLSNGRLPVFTALPPQGEAVEVLNTFFTYTKDVFPLFHPDTFTDLLHNSYERRRPRDPSWWAGLNIALAIGYRYRSLHQHDQSGARTKSNVYYKNALATVPELLLRRPDLMAVQALIGIVFLSCNGFDTPMYQNILSIAIRSCVEFGIHDTCVVPPSSCREQEQLMLILSLGYTMDELQVLPRDHIEPA
ncbi:hypothetical protein ABOM_001903 [Aspergillus bombycis]|uniref:Xylanolytic transcriptional activator regulatory domain-containing protein n=1 Tax=Aspergillus bombycis TaxID=109264 RepID=A0A1F8AD90_9EURO|nr:hypothetical protein ABOM_001903 [Aspergillus bombycis]OGM49647.1 hypothetical protein ABOM_001903 [Aspergillus bombycis]